MHVVQLISLVCSCRYGGSGVLLRDDARKMHESGGLSFSGKAMLHLLRARLAPQRPAVADGIKRVDSKSLVGFMNTEGPESGVLSKVFKLWNKDGSTGPSRTKKKLATVKCGEISGGCVGSFRSRLRCRRSRLALAKLQQTRPTKLFPGATLMLSMVLGRHHKGSF